MTLTENEFSTASGSLKYNGDDIAPFKITFNPETQMIKMAAEPPVGTLLDAPCVLNMGAIQSDNKLVARREAERAAVTLFRITGTTGKAEKFNVYSVVYNIPFDEAKRMGKRNNDIMTYDGKPMPGSKKSEDFARKYIIGDANPPANEDAVNWWGKRFSRLTISTFCMGSMIGCEMLNKCNAILQEKGLSRKQAEQVLSHVKMISAADASDVPFFQSGATVYRVLNKKDNFLPPFTDNLRTVEDWIKDSQSSDQNGSVRKDGHDASQDIAILTSRYYPHQHLISIDKGTWLEPLESPENRQKKLDPSKGLYLADLQGNFAEHTAEGKIKFSIDRTDPIHHKSATYYRHTLGKHGFLVPALVQNLHLNAINHMLSVEESGVLSEVPPIEKMVMPPEKELYQQDLPERYRGMWTDAQRLADIDSDGPGSYRARVERGLQHVHEVPGLQK